MIICIFGATRDEVADLYKRLPDPGMPHSVTWRLSSTFAGPIGHACFTDDENIQDSYREAKLRVLREKVDPDAQPEETPAAKPKAKRAKKKSKKKADE